MCVLVQVKFMGLGCMHHEFYESSICILFEMATHCVGRELWNLFLNLYSLLSYCGSLQIKPLH